jgi:hypothetical protein
MSHTTSIPLFGKAKASDQSKDKPSYPVYKLRQEQCDKYGIDPSFSMMQIELDSFMANVLHY